MQWVFVAVFAVLLSLVAAYDGDVLVKNTLGEFTEDFERSENVAYLHLRQELHLSRHQQANPVSDSDYHTAVALVQSLGTNQDQKAALEQVKSILNRMKQSELLQFMTEFNTSTTNTLLSLSEGSSNTTMLMEIPENKNYGYHASTIGACLLLTTALVAIILVVRVYHYENDAAIIAHVLKAIHDKDKAIPDKEEIVVVV
ncbi:hypothetical protein THRCLA_11125 [Thraustotheca clavata]|uniref:Secreted protein n=1 Tax=Thraustotheca clavata TaxID=74557 RepID=A0A1V9Y8Z1_9STRA|nr:hypothetical protein THRCLA_11125 [Thraustotheca clavata]